MTFDITEVNYIYIGTVIIIAIIAIMTICHKYQRNKTTNLKTDITILTSDGVRRMDNTQIKAELEQILTKLLMHKESPRLSKFSREIDNVIANLKLFIKNNPGIDACKSIDLKADIINQAMNDYVTPFNEDRNIAIQTVISHDDIESTPDSKKFEQLLQNLAAIIDMFHSDICDNGLIDIKALEEILRELDLELTQNAIYNPITHKYSDSNFTSSFGKSLKYSQNPNMVQSAMLFGSSISQIEGLQTETPLRPNIDPKNKESQFYVGPINIRCAQERSQLLQSNHAKLGDGHYVDEFLLTEPKYEDLAL